MIGTEPSQLDYRRALFVCSAGLHRSATGATIGSLLGLNTRACGTKQQALVPISANLILWADSIYFMEQEHFNKTTNMYWSYNGLVAEIRRKAVICDIEDVYDYMQPELVETLEKLLT